ncbi:hypothetical protein [Planktotalea arctica]|uniref:hypothetical protein n=1 Tax=Planktotalea arctica TaxID=1481893 RepID=UPI000A17514F|nr:hypothetical protein [Planktotalea arctica]
MSAPELEITPQMALRPPSTVMRLRRMGAMFPTRLSFLRTLMRDLSAQNVQVQRAVWEMDADGFGHAVYTISLGGYDYSLVAISTDLPPEMRTDRVIATAWDTAYVLYDGIPDASEIARIVATAPKQEASRYTARDLVLSRANKSVRLFQHVTDALKRGDQPDEAMVRDVGYLMRTTAVYGNGKFGIADRAHIAARPCLGGPFAAEMLTVWLIRGFTHDLAEHVGGAPLDPRLKRHLGIGNSTGLGMAPFLVSHPRLLDSWMQVRETALARVAALPALSADQQQTILALAQRASLHLSEWSVPDAGAEARILQIRHDWARVQALLGECLPQADPLARVLQGSEGWFEDTQELLIALLLEPFGDLIDGLTECMANPYEAEIEPGMPLADLRALIARDWDWAVGLDFKSKSESAQFWYVSEAKQEPRLGLRHIEEGADLESPLDIARQVQRLSRALDGQDGITAELLMRRPDLRFAARRVQNLAKAPYSEIRDNLIGAQCLPIDMLRCKLSFFGAAKFDPKSDRWTRITMCQGAPLFDELQAADDWWLPTFEG